MSVVEVIGVTRLLMLRASKSLAHQCSRFLLAVKGSSPKDWETVGTAQEGACCVRGSLDASTVN